MYQPRCNDKSKNDEDISPDSLRNNANDSCENFRKCGRPKNTSAKMLSKHQG